MAGARILLWDVMSAVLNTIPYTGNSQVLWDKNYIKQNSPTLSRNLGRNIGVALLVSRPVLRCDRVDALKRQRTENSFKERGLSGTVRPSDDMENRIRHRSSSDLLRRAAAHNRCDEFRRSMNVIINPNGRIHSHKAPPFKSVAECYEATLPDDRPFDTRPQVTQQLMPASFTSQSIPCVCRNSARACFNGCKNVGLRVKVGAGWVRWACRRPGLASIRSECHGQCGSPALRPLR